MAEDKFKKSILLDSSFLISLARTVWKEKKDESLSAYKQGKLKRREMADLLGLNYWELDELLEKENMPVIQ